MSIVHVNQNNKTIYNSHLFLLERTFLEADLLGWKRGRKPFKTF